ncbi:sugar/nucleoside kinase (ribokinase family) [Arthrobacter pigmenti]|uniref:Sugar/nucleoside kinase (Ribokinase family) n=1 Tax=Arthrobacter pigmenti TaxID=271432 RepID=A0A846RWC7_9MICC|nr:sugar/nucleoside kinase (ribokinase family) [Arthrobacter pigmenti]
MHSIAVAGHLCLDITPPLGDTVRLKPGQLVEVGQLSITLGGSVANTGRALADLGAAVTPYASIGDDELGALLLSKLDAQGFGTPRLNVSSQLATSYSLVIERPGVDRTFWHHTGANDEFDGTFVRVEGHDLLHVGYPTLLPGVLTDGGRPLHTLLARARAEGVTTSIDLAVVDRTSSVGSLDWHSILELAFSECDIASPSFDDLTSALRIDEPYSLALVDRLADRMLDQGVAIVAISAGGHRLRLRTGSAARLRRGGRVLAPLAETWADQALTVPPLWVDNPITTNGAGDASTAGLLFALSGGATPTLAAALAAASSALVISGDRPTPAGVTCLEPTLATLFAP